MTTSYDHSIIDEYFRRTQSIITKHGGFRAMRALTISVQGNYVHEGFPKLYGIFMVFFTIFD